jgi:folate-binding protein YgfZ
VIELALHGLHLAWNARFTGVNGVEVVESYGDTGGEYEALRHAAGVLDLSCRSRLCLTGSERKRFLHGQVTNQVQELKEGEGCYAALVTAKGKLLSDLNIYSLAEELLLDFEPGLSQAVADRFDKFIIADDVQVVDVAAHYGLLSLQGPKYAETLQAAGLDAAVPAKVLHFVRISHVEWGEVYCVNHPRGTAGGVDVFVPTGALHVAAEQLVSAAQALGGRACGWQALETARIEAGVPRFGADMDESNLAPEAGIEERAISYSKGCYIGQEVIARIRTYGQVAKSLCGLLLPAELPALPPPGEKLFRNGKEAGYITSAARSPAWQRNLALGYVRRESNAAGTELELSSPQSGKATVVALPFRFEG